MVRNSLVAYPFVIERPAVLALSQPVQASIHDSRRLGIVLDPVEDLRQEPELVDGEADDRRPGGVTEHLPQRNEQPHSAGALRYPRGSARTAETAHPFLLTENLVTAREMPGAGDHQDVGFPAY